MTELALIAGAGALPRLLAAALGEPFILAELEGIRSEVAAEPLCFRLERLVPFLEHLHGLGVRRVVLAGGVRRPRLDPELFDSRTAALVPRLLAAMQGGDDAALRLTIGIFEDWGFEVLGPDQVAPDLVPGAGVLTGAPSPQDEADAARAAAIVAAIGAEDLGQGAVVVQGLCLATEALPGTDAMLDFAARHRGLLPDPAPRSGVLYKAPKPRQDRRVDLPAIGPDTVARAAAAGLAGIAWEAGGVLLLDRAATLAAAEAAGLFLWSRLP
ncbi:UDP-2,3-diacylglucosamine diphosphatase LpxI domain-containing protein [Phaeovulum sp.]|uniref:UDP-2,3-diacylglucosamine diphosphatase LpxI domain-containing protein n=1 Tax=Phaeovulum sp. TaxID=2934796 RepID=UPI0027311C0F|nr:UDP-2,3-diacylglucosamine diphosphatase LpxI [Phaeovulum sp.]MDP1670209.1 UDP-2,3-diacylglucosamine diphosphatase LpxI [Phaeovulum sp.]MDZ4120295.1 UDP-2,3-diacylglucosamine diphosphatase LpxI [Phaeovulum sp.]